MSGGLVLAADADFRFGHRAVGVVTEHHLPEGESALTVTQITELAPDGWALLGVDVTSLPTLPRPVVDTFPPYLETVAELACRTPVLLDQEAEPRRAGRVRHRR